MIINTLNNIPANSQTFRLPVTLLKSTLFEWPDHPSTARHKGRMGLALGPAMGSAARPVRDLHRLSSLLLPGLSVLTSFFTTAASMLSQLRGQICIYCSIFLNRLVSAVGWTACQPTDTPTCGSSSILLAVFYWLYPPCLFELFPLYLQLNQARPSDSEAGLCRVLYPTPCWRPDCITRRRIKACFCCRMVDLHQASQNVVALSVLSSVVDIDHSGVHSPGKGHACDCILLVHGIRPYSDSHPRWFPQQGFELEFQPLAHLGWQRVKAEVGKRSRAFVFEGT